jgi:hypothetical protein
VKIWVAVPFSKWAVLSGVITKATFKDCTEFYNDFMAKVQHSIATELPRPLLAGPVSPFAAVDAGEEGEGAGGTALMGGWPCYQQCGEDHGIEKALWVCCTSDC